MLGLGAVGHPRAGGGHPLDLGLVQVHGVVDEQAGSEHAEGLKVVQGALAKGGHGAGGLAGGLGQMDVDVRVQLLGQGHGPLQQRRRAGVGGVRHHHPGDAGVVGVLGDQLAGDGETVFQLAVGGRGEIVDHLADGGAQAGVLHRAGGLGREEVHVNEAGDPVLDHLHAGQHGPPVDLVAGEPLLHGEDVLLQPLLQSQVVGHPAHEGHGRVGVGVDEPRRMSPPAASSTSAWPTGGAWPAGPQKGDAGVVDVQGAVFHHRVFRVHGDDGAVVDY